MQILLTAKEAGVTNLNGFVKVKGKPPRPTAIMSIAEFEEISVGYLETATRLHQAFGQLYVAEDQAKLASTLTRWDYLLMALFGPEWVAKRVKAKAYL